MKKLVFLAMFSGAVMLSGCASGGVLMPVGLIYTDIRGPVTATGVPNRGDRVGRASARSILGLVATGDASIETAARTGGITRISHVDFHTTSILGIITKTTVYVYGD